MENFRETFGSGLRVHGKSRRPWGGMDWKAKSMDGDIGSRGDLPREGCRRIQLNRESSATIAAIFAPALLRAAVRSVPDSFTSK